MFERLKRARGVRTNRDPDPACYLEPVDPAGEFWARLMPLLMEDVAELRGIFYSDNNPTDAMEAIFGAANIAYGPRRHGVLFDAEYTVTITTTPEVMRRAFQAQPDPMEWAPEAQVGLPRDPSAFDSNDNLLWRIDTGLGTIAVYPPAPAFPVVCRDTRAGVHKGGCPADFQS